jgi:hypothetical protein
MQISESFLHRISTESVKVSMGNMENSLCGLMKIRLYYRSIWFEIKIARQLFVEVFRTKF